MTANSQPVVSWKFQPCQTRLFRKVKRGTGYYTQLIAPQCLEVGGQRSGKTQGKFKFGVDNYCLKFGHCDILVLRRKFGELESGVIQDFKTIYRDLLEKGLCKYNESKHVAEFANGSRIVFGGCVAKGTLIDTQRGLIPIEEVTIEDWALTRIGYRKVLWSGQTGVKKVSPLGPLYLTDDHKVLLNDDFIKFNSIKDICQKDTENQTGNLPVQENNLLIRKTSYLKACAIAGISTEGIHTSGTAILQRDHFIEPFIEVCTALFRKAWSFITSIITPSIIPVMEATTNCFPIQITKNITNQFYTDPSTFAPGVVGNLKLGNLEEDFVRIPVQQVLTSTILSKPQQINTGFYPFGGRVRNAIKSLLQLLDSNQSNASVPVDVSSNCVPVYDLTIDEQHEYFANGIAISNCLNNKDKDIETYLGQAYSYILVDEVAQFSPDAWEMLYMRNTVNAGCEPDEHGNLPIPSMCGCTNPLGPFWDYYHATFALHAELGKAGIGKGEPFIKEEEWKKAKDGSWWYDNAGEMVCKYNPAQFAVNHSTMMENFEYLKRDPMAIPRLKTLPEAKQKKYLYGLLDKVGGQYFEPFSSDEDVIDLREDPYAVIWQPWQPVWGGQDWGIGHWSACYLFTKGLVRKSVGEDYKLKTICFAEIAPTSTGHTPEEIVDMINQKAYYPQLPENHPQFLSVSRQRCNVKTIYFSHEKFNRVMEQHSPSDEYTQVLRSRGLPGVTPATRDRIGSASFLYTLIKKREICILKTCPGIITAIPQLQRDEKNLDDVQKTNSMADDRYDAFRYGVYGELGTRPTPRQVSEAAYMKTLDPFMKHFYERKAKLRRIDEDTPWVPDNYPSWAPKP
jgi:hypothetical protein